MGLYYLSPNNYLITKWEDSKFKLEYKNDYTIKPDSSLIVSSYNNKNMYLRFSEQTNLVVKNSFKSQNININKEIDLIKSKCNSEIFIINNSNIENKITIQFYSII